NNYRVSYYITEPAGEITATLPIAPASEYLSKSSTLISPSSTSKTKRCSANHNNDFLVIEGNTVSDLGVTNLFVSFSIAKKFADENSSTLVCVAGSKYNTSS